MSKNWLWAMFLMVFVLAYAEAAEIDLDKIVVTPSRIEESIQGTTSAITVFTRNDIERSNSDSIKDFIKEAVGLDMTQTGSFGGPVSVFLRGTNAGQTQIMIDNVRIYDPISTNSAFDLAHLTLDNVERIEVVRGPQSVLYGSDAMGGVINIVTKKGDGRPSFDIATETGSYDYYKGAVSSQGRIKDFSYSLGLSRLKTRGISKLKGTNEKDPYQDSNYSLKLDYDFDHDNTAGLIARFTDAVYEYDNSVGLVDDPDLTGKEQQTIFSGFIENKILEKWVQKIQFSFMRNYRQDLNDKDDSNPNDYLRDWYIGENQQLDWQNTIKLAGFDTIVCGFDWQKEMGNYYYYTEYLGGSSETHFPKALSRTKGYYLENMVNLDDIFRFNSGFRIDDHSYAGTKQTYKLDASYLFKSKTKIKGGWGTAFKAPTLYQLKALSDPWFGGGNPNLQPEESQTYEIGLEQKINQDKLSLGLTYFHTQLKNIIDAKYNPLTWYTDAYSNISKARIFGYELTLTLKPCTKIKIDSGYTWQDTEDKTNGDELLKRPKNKVYSNLSLAFNEKLSLGLKILYVGSRSDAGNTLLKSYTRLDLNANYRVNSHAQLFFKIDNLTDADYEEVKNYAQPGRSFFTGMKLSF